MLQLLDMSPSPFVVPVQQLSPALTIRWQIRLAFAQLPARLGLPV
jgi:hypothetical protein